ALFCDRGFDRVSDRVNASVGGDQQRLRNRERGIQNGDTGGGLGIEARHFLVRLLVGNERGGLAFTAGSGGRRNRDQRQHRLGRPADSPKILDAPAVRQEKIAAFRRVHAAAPAQTHNQ